MHGHGISVAGGVRLTVTRNRFFSCRDAALFLMHDLDPSAGAEVVFEDNVAGWGVSHVVAAAPSPLASGHGDALRHAALRIAGTQVL